MTDDLRVLVETAMARALHPAHPWGRHSRFGKGCDKCRGEAKRTLDAALSVRGPSGTPALIWRDDLKQVGWYGRYGIVPGGTDVDAAPHYRPVFVVRTEEQS